MNDEEFARMLVKYRDEPACDIHFSPRIDSLMDSELCRRLSMLLHNNSKWVRQKATANLAEMLPSKRGLYMFIWRPEFIFRCEEVPEVERFFGVLYVGKAGIENGTNDTIKQRYKSEYSKFVGQDADLLWTTTVPTKRHERLGKYLTLRPLEFWHLEMESIPDIHQFEKKLISMFRPPLNDQHLHYLRPGKPEPA